MTCGYIDLCKDLLIVTSLTEVFGIVKIQADSLQGIIGGLGCLCKRVTVHCSKITSSIKHGKNFMTAT